ncbi:RNA polymerase sigma-70 factor [Fulvivirgaceae bacterium BMA12]|uniref:RNA polymerase sigma-70 factor n=1 Tax=Agaribacillus aureus TaxID=3051825 RepID=A0ABT8LDR2_9BACT|nr:RNA polymerase sigma-70 factor [Fulvivirgaceae bacterium BMA12]
MNEVKLLQGIKSGNASCYEEVFRRYYQPLCLFSLKYVKDPDEAEEIVQNMFVRIWQKRKELAIATSVKSYLYQSVRNACLNHLKHNNIKLDYQKNALATTSSASASDTLVALELEVKVRETLHKLPPERKKIFLMSRNEGLKYREIAEKLNISVKTVENQMSQALKFLKSELADFLGVILAISVQIIEKLWP